MKKIFFISCLIVFLVYFIFSPKKASIKHLPLQPVAILNKKPSPQEDSFIYSPDQDLSFEENEDYDFNNIAEEDYEEDFDWTEYEGEVHASLFLEDYINYKKNFIDEVEDEDLVYCDAQVIHCIPKDAYTPLIKLEAEVFSLQNETTYEEGIQVKTSYFISCLTRAQHCASRIVYSPKIPDAAPELPYYYEGVRENQESLIKYQNGLLEDLLNKL